MFVTLFLVSEYAFLYLFYSNQFNPLPILSNNSANPSVSYSTRNARSFPHEYDKEWQPELQGAAFPTAPPPPLLPWQRSPACAFWCIYPKVKSQFWMKLRLWGVLVQHQRIGCMLSKSCALLQELWSAGCCVCLTTASSSVLSAQHQLLPNLQQAGTQMQLKESTEREELQGKCSSGCGAVGQGPWNHAFSNQHFGYFNREQHLHIKHRICFSHSKCTSVWMEQSGQMSLRLPFGGGGRGAKHRQNCVQLVPSHSKVL